MSDNFHHIFGTTFQKCGLIIASNLFTFYSFTLLPFYSFTFYSFTFNCMFTVIASIMRA